MSQDQTYCTWSQEDEDSYIWLTDCGGTFILNDGDPKENGMQFCCYCGAVIDVVLYEAPEEIK